MIHFPFVSRQMHAEVCDRLERQIASMEAERRLLLDRLAVLGLGGPLFAANTESAAEPDVQAEEIAQDPDTALMNELARFKHRPSRLADTFGRALERRQGIGSAIPRVAWIPAQEKVTAMLDQAEEQGKRVNGS